MSEWRRLQRATLPAVDAWVDLAYGVDGPGDVSSQTDGASLQRYVALYGDALATWWRLRPMTAWEADCLHWRGRVLTGQHQHWCHAWDGLPIDETCPEWPCCDEAVSV